MDASALLSRMEQLSLEVSRLREALEAQENVSENLEAAAVVMDRRITAVERLRGSPATTAAKTPAFQKEEAREPMEPAHQSHEQGSDALPQSPVWSTIVRKGKHKPQKLPNAAAQPSDRVLPSRLQCDQRRKICLCNEICS